MFDTTGAYSVSNPGGYGPENGVTGPTDFDTYTLTLWAPGLDPSTDTPTAVINLIDPPPTGPDDEGAYSWEFTLSQLGVASVADGIWYGEAVGVKDGDTYAADPFMPVFTRALRDQLSTRLATYDPSCGCSDGCEDPLELWMALKSVTCEAYCSREQTQRILTDLQHRIPNCC